jgi:hypothetical protein
MEMIFQEVIGSKLNKNVPSWELASNNRPSVANL